MSASDLRTPASAATQLENLLALHDEEFVANAYRTLLKRPADPSGLASHVALLREGADKALLIVELARSQEGLEAAVDLPGLTEFVRANTPTPPSLATRLVWRLAQLFMAPLYPRVRALDNQLHALEFRLVRRVDQLEAALASAPMAGRAGIPGSGAQVKAEARQIADALLAAIHRADLSPGTAVFAARLGAALRSRQGST